MPSSWNRTSGEPEVPPDVPPEYADAYLAGFRRGLGGLEPDAPSEQVEPAPGPVPPERVEPRVDETAAVPTDDPVVHPRSAGTTHSEVSVQRSPEAGVDSERETGSTDLEWLFDRRESGPPGWTVASPGGSADDTANEPRTDGAGQAVTRSGASSVAGQGPRSPWPLLGVFLVILLLLMLLAYLGGMAFSTIMNR